MQFANQTDSLLSCVTNIGERKKEDMEQEEFYKT